MNVKKKLIIITLIMLVVGTTIPLTYTVKADDTNRSINLMDQYSILFDGPEQLLPKIFFLMMIFINAIFDVPPYWEGGYH